jgi:DNA-binding SARP family transcriptional activator
MRTRELKDEAMKLYAQRRFIECAGTYARLLALEPEDPSLHLRHAEACRRAGTRHEARAAYRKAAELWTRRGHEARARAALRLALALEPHPELEPELELELTRLSSAFAPLVLTDEHGPLGLEVTLLPGDG